MTFDKRKELDYDFLKSAALGFLVLSATLSVCATLAHNNASVWAASIAWFGTLFLYTQLGLYYRDVRRQLKK